MSEKPLRNNTAKFYIQVYTVFFAKFELLSWFWLFMAFQLGAIEKFVFYVYQYVICTPTYCLFHCTFVPGAHYIYRIHLFTFVIMRCPYPSHWISLKEFLRFFFHCKKYFLSQNTRKRQVAKYVSNVIFLLLQFISIFFLRIFGIRNVRYDKFVEKIFFFLLFVFIEIINSSD